MNDSVTLVPLLSAADEAANVCQQPVRPGLSIVVPVYRGAATIGRLVDALSELDPAGGLEVVLVNDGSPDNSGEVCRDLLATEGGVAEVEVGR